MMSSTLEHIRVQLVQAAITICKNALNFKQTIKITGSVEITVDQKESITLTFHEIVYTNESNLSVHLDTLHPASIVEVSVDDCARVEAIDQVPVQLATTQNVVCDRECPEDINRFETEIIHNEHLLEIQEQDKDSKSTINQIKVTSKCGDIEFTNMNSGMIRNDTNTDYEKEFADTPNISSKIICNESKYTTNPFTTDIQFNRKINERELRPAKECVQSIKETTTVIIKKNNENKAKQCKNNQKKFKCNMCGKVCSRKGHLEEHIRTHTGEKPYQCLLCKKSFCQSGALSTHMATHESKNYQCDVCERFFTASSSLTSHIRIHTGEKPYKCDVCRVCFKDAGSFSNHKKLHLEKKAHQCSMCGMMFSLRASLKRHIMSHTGEKPYRCSMCPDKSFTNSYSLKVHHRRHTGEKPYQCAKCGSMFVSKSNLIHHNKVHQLEQNKIPCNTCHKLFSCNQSLKKHMLCVHKTSLLE